MPRWVKVFGILGLLVVALLVVVLLFGGGGHNPGRHSLSREGGHSHLPGLVSHGGRRP